MSRHEVRIGPSILTADLLRLGEEVAAAEQAGVDYLHLDIMDGVFVPNISFGLPIVEAVRRATKLPIEVHLMIVEPDRYVGRFVDAGAEVVSVHAEGSIHLHRTLRMISEAGAAATVVLNPATPVVIIEEVIPVVDQILVMGVNPGFGGQSFIPTTLDKVTRVRTMLDQRNPACRLQVDGGVKESNIRRVVEAGADSVVVGSALFSADRSAAEAVAALRAALA